MLDDIDTEGSRQWARMRERIDSSVDPGVGALARLRKCAVEAWKCISPEAISVDDLKVALMMAGEARRDDFFEQWSRQVYDVAAVTSSVDLNRKPDDVSLKAFLEERTKSFIGDLLDETIPLDPVAAQRETALESVAPKDAS